MDYYNEIEPYAAQWLRNLANADQIPPGVVDTKSIVAVQADDLAEYRRCHFFAGIAGWVLALRLAGWPEDVPVWTGSCPCQPFSAAGKQKGEADERHLWPTFRGLIEKRRPPVVFGEQVASPLGRQWLAGVRTDLEDLGYRVGCADLCAAGVGAPHIRQRLYWVADSSEAGRKLLGSRDDKTGSDASGDDADGRGADCRVGDTECSRVGGRDQSGSGSSRGKVGQPEDGSHPADESSHRREASGGLVDPLEPRLEGHSGNGNGRSQPGRLGEEAAGSAAKASGDGWSRSYLVHCSDGKARRVGPGLFPLAHGVPSRVGKLRAYGNAIVPQVATRFIKAYLSCLPR